MDPGGVAYPSYSARHNEGFNLEGCSIKVLYTPDIPWSRFVIY